MSIDREALAEDVAMILSGAPFPSAKTRSRARAVVGHVAPLIIAAVREQVAVEIEGHADKRPNDYGTRWISGDTAARIARGDRA